MVDAIASGSSYDPIAYLNNIKGNTKPVAPKTPTATTTPSNAANPLQSPNPVNVAPDLLSVLQGTDPNSFQARQLSNLLGGTGTNNALGSLFSAALNNNSSLAPLQNALASLKQQKAQLSTQTDFIAKATASRNAATNAYNKTLITNAQAAIKASYQTPPTSA
jgi:hypothetical protein